MKIISFFSALIIILLFSCSPTEPPDGGNGNIEPDTTSQNFSFEKFEFGDGDESSYFNDVWIFDENNIWVVGYISPSDTTVNGTQIINPNIIRWDGSSWNLQPFSGVSSGINGIWAFDSSLIYFAAGGIIKYQNNNYDIIVIQGNWSQGQRIEQLWGSSESNIWGVGPWGTIVHFNGQVWSKIDFDTQWYFYDITGISETGIGYAVALNQFNDCIVVKLQNLTPEIIYQKSLSEIKITSLSITESDGYFYISGSDFQSTKICRLSQTGEIELIHELPPTQGISQAFAFHKKDIYFFGEDYSEGRFVHYNGVRFTSFNFPDIDPDNYGGIHAIKDLAVSVGFSNNKGYILKIKRSPL